ncbi:hypothetical protein BJY00DRAFT_317119 [Aspergillus carlsbadensis]|nr:hypothetical protein BJY00DRAFT_317119 [Aspergillus carlsbadensis]
MEPQPYTLTSVGEEPEENTSALQITPNAFSLFATTTHAPMLALSAHEPSHHNNHPLRGYHWAGHLGNVHPQTTEMVARPEGAFAYADSAPDNAAVQGHIASTYPSTAFVPSRTGDTVSGNAIAPPSMVVTRLNALTSAQLCHYCHARDTLGTTNESNASRFQCKWQGCANKPSFLREGDLIRHLKTIHISPDAYRCRVHPCHKPFGRKDHLLEHRKRCHPSS